MFPTLFLTAAGAPSDAAWRVAASSSLLLRSGLGTERLPRSIIETTQGFNALNFRPHVCHVSPVSVAIPCVRCAHET